MILLLAAGNDDQQKAAPLGLFVLLLLGVTCYFLFRSMSRHLKRVRDDFPIGVLPPEPVESAPTRRTTAVGDGAGPDPDNAIPPAPQ